ncbi:MAG: phosphoribosylanthranilate isomerase [Bryobacteraceae bacterium]
MNQAPVLVKVCGITTREDALAAVEAGASALGFNFYANSPRYVTEERAAEIVEALPEGILKIGVFVDDSAGHVLAVARRVGLTLVQLHGGLVSVPMRFWRALPANGTPIRENHGAEAILLDTPSSTFFGGTGTTFPWEVARGFPGRVVIAGGLDGSNVRAAIAQARPWGVDACSRLESSPGIKDHAKMRAFVRAALSETV